MQCVISCMDVVQAIRLFPCGSAGGPENAVPTFKRPAVCSSRRLQPSDAWEHPRTGEVFLYWCFTGGTVEERWRSVPHCSGVHSEMVGNQSCI